MGAILAAYHSDQNLNCSAFYNLISKLAYHHFYYILLATQTNPSGTLQRTTQRVNTTGWSSVGTILGTAYHSTSR